MSLFLGRQRAKVRRHSRLKGTERSFWEPIQGGDIREARYFGARVVKVAKHYTRHHKAKGKRHGGLGYVAIEILEAMTQLVDFKTGQLDPSYKYLSERLKRSVDAISRGLKQLRAHGFIDWIRRFENTLDANGRTISVQTSNAYRIMLPESAVKLLGLVFKSAPKPVDEEQRLAELEAKRKRDLAQLKHGEQERFIFGETSELGNALAKLGKLVRQSDDSSDSVIRSEPIP